jgi:hypothetical protein
MQLVIDYLNYIIHYFTCSVFRHGSEPTVKLTYSDKSSTSATISLGVSDVVSTEEYRQGKNKFLNVS